MQNVHRKNQILEKFLCFSPNCRLTGGRRTEELPLPFSSFAYTHCVHTPASHTMAIDAVPVRPPLSQGPGQHFRTSWSREWSQETTWRNLSISRWCYMAAVTQNGAFTLPEATLLHPRSPTTWRRALRAVFSNRQKTQRGLGAGAGPGPSSAVLSGCLARWPLSWARWCWPTWPWQHLSAPSLLLH